MSPLDRAIEAAGGVTKLAGLLKLRQSVVSNWRMRGQVSAQHVLTVESLTGVSRHDLRPDVFGAAPTKAKRRAA